MNFNSKHIVKPLVIFGTRPEFIKLFPVIEEMKRRSYFKVVTCNTEQQKELSNQALDVFNSKADISLNIMEFNQSLPNLHAKLLIRLQNIVSQEAYDCIIVQGDTMTVMAASQIAFYNRIPLFHVEAGLRSYNFSHPFPEEMIRKAVSSFADLNFVPTQKARDALIKENIKKEIIFVTGNTAIDTVLHVASTCDKDHMHSTDNIKRQTVLVTIHRRENQSNELDNIINAIKKLSYTYTHIEFIIPVHPNPNVKNRIISQLEDINNIKIVDPLGYKDLIYIMKKSCLILTDSGGIQEEAPTFSIPLLVLRKHTERQEGVEAGCSKLIGTDTNNIYNEACRILDNKISNKKVKNPYGDGKAAERIADIIEKYFGIRKNLPSEFIYHFV